MRFNFRMSWHSIIWWVKDLTMDLYIIDHIIIIIVISSSK